jgi:hypothetical protein
LHLCQQLQGLAVADPFFSMVPKTYLMIVEQICNKLEFFQKLESFS